MTGYAVWRPGRGPAVSRQGVVADSAEAIVQSAVRVASAGDLAAIDEEGLTATPGNRAINELITDAARRSQAKSDTRIQINSDEGPKGDISA